MPDRHDDEDLPLDLRDTGRLLRGHRAQATPVELDGIWQRARHGAGRARRPARSRGRALVTALLTTGLIATTGATAVIAATSVGGGARTLTKTALTEQRDTAACQYDDDFLRGAYTADQTKGSASATITVTQHCGDAQVCVEASKDISNYAFDTGEKYEHRMGPSICVKIPAGATSITVKAGRTTFTFAFPTV